MRFKFPIADILLFVRCIGCLKTICQSCCYKSRALAYIIQTYLCVYVPPVLLSDRIENYSVSAESFLASICVKKLLF